MKIPMVVTLMSLIRVEVVVLDEADNCLMAEELDCDYGLYGCLVLGGVLRGDATGRDVEAWGILL